MHKTIRLTVVELSSDYCCFFV